jgi:hypothetical protein
MINPLDDSNAVKEIHRQPNNSCNLTEHY